MSLKHTKVGVFGGGVVGTATARSYVEHVAEVRVNDIDPTRGTHKPHEVMECDIVFVCLPSPRGEKGLNVSVLEDFLDYYRGYTKNLVIKSTVPVGFTRFASYKFDLPNLVHSPEFLTARCALTDASLPSRNIVGAVKGCGGAGMSYRDGVISLIELYRERFPHVPLFSMFSDESEAVKLMLNSFFAVKVAFWNEMHEYATTTGLNWDVVLGGILSDGRVHPSHTQVPGPDGKFGFGGACLPKDLAGMIDCIIKEHSTPHVCAAALARNESDRMKPAGKSS